MALAGACNQPVCQVLQFVVVMLTSCGTRWCLQPTCLSGLAVRCCYADFLWHSLVLATNLFVRSYSLLLLPIVAYNDMCKTTFADRLATTVDVKVAVIEEEFLLFFSSSSSAFKAISLGSLFLLFFWGGGGGGGIFFIFYLAYVTVFLIQT